MKFPVQELFRTARSARRTGGRLQVLRRGTGRGLGQRRNDRQRRGAEQPLQRRDVGVESLRSRRPTWLPTHPANGQRPPFDMASSVRRAWLRQPSLRPTTSTTPRPRRSGRSLRKPSGCSGTRQPPAPSTMANSAPPVARPYQSTRSSGVRHTPASAAARWGATAGAKQYGLVSSYGSSTELSAASARASALRNPLPRRLGPARDRLEADHSMAPAGKDPHQRAGDQGLADAGVGAGDEDAAGGAMGGIGKESGS